jgi:hypothetical protein
VVQPLVAKEEAWARALELPRIKDAGSTVSEKTPCETVRKAPLGLGLKPQKATKRAQKALFAALGAKNERLQRLF